MFGFSWSKKKEPFLLRVETKTDNLPNSNDPAVVARFELITDKKDFGQMREKFLHEQSIEELARKKADEERHRKTLEEYKRSIECLTLCVKRINTAVENGYQKTECKCLNPYDESALKARGYSVTWNEKRTNYGELLDRLFPMVYWGDPDTKKEKCAPVHSHVYIPYD